MSLGCTVRELLMRMGADELRDWIAYYQIEPFGEEREDLRNAQICCLLANIHRGKKQRAFKLEDFLLFKEPKKQSMQEMKNIFRSLAARSKRK